MKFSSFASQNKGKLALLAALGTAASCAVLKHPENPAEILTDIPVLGQKQELLTKEKLAEALKDSAPFYKFPTEMELETGKAVLEYAFDPKLQDSMEDLFRSYKPDYGAFVAIDAATGQVLSMVSYSARGKNPQGGNLALRASFPSASVFKVVTAAAAIETRKYHADTLVSFNGANHTLYRSNVLKNNVTRWTRYTTLKSAFAKSINTVFGKIGAFAVAPEQLKEYAHRFGFNQEIQADFPVEQGKAPISDDPWERAESASGYTRDNTMSPLQGAMIAAAIANDGVMMEPYIVRSVYTVDGKEVYSAKPRMAAQSVDRRTAMEMKDLMKETVTHGTSQKSFRGFFRREYSQLTVGGKTGSLTGLEPRGKYDWFVGYADAGNRRIAVAALTIHEKLWRVKSSYVARKAFESYFKDPSRTLASRASRK